MSQFSVQSIRDLVVKGTQRHRHPFDGVIGLDPDRNSLPPVFDGLADHLDRAAGTNKIILQPFFHQCKNGLYTLGLASCEDSQNQNLQSNQRIPSGDSIPCCRICRSPPSALFPEQGKSRNFGVGLPGLPGISDMTFHLLRFASGLKRESMNSVSQPSVDNPEATAKHSCQVVFKQQMNRMNIIVIDFYSLRILFFVFQLLAIDCMANPAFMSTQEGIVGCNDRVVRNRSWKNLPRRATPGNPGRSNGFTPFGL